MMTAYAQRIEGYVKEIENQIVLGNYSIAATFYFSKVRAIGQLAIQRARKIVETGDPRDKEALEEYIEHLRVSVEEEYFCNALSSYLNAENEKVLSKDVRYGFVIDEDLRIYPAALLKEVLGINL